MNPRFPFLATHRFGSPVTPSVQTFLPSSISSQSPSQNPQMRLFCENSARPAAVPATPASGASPLAPSPTRGCPALANLAAEAARLLVVETAEAEAIQVFRQCFAQALQSANEVVSSLDGPRDERSTVLRRGPGTMADVHSKLSVVYEAVRSAQVTLLRRIQRSLDDITTMPAEPAPPQAAAPSIPGDLSLQQAANNPEHLDQKRAEHVYRQCFDMAKGNRLQASTWYLAAFRVAAHFCETASDRKATWQLAYWKAAIFAARSVMEHNEALESLTIMRAKQDRLQIPLPEQLKRDHEETEKLLKHFDDFGKPRQATSTPPQAKTTARERCEQNQAAFDMVLRDLASAADIVTDAEGQLKNRACDREKLKSRLQHALDLHRCAELNLPFLEKRVAKDLNALSQRIDDLSKQHAKAPQKPGRR